MEDHSTTDESGPVRRRKTVAFVKLLERVQITGVPQIVTAKDRKSKTYKLLVFVSCLIGFIIQLTLFMLKYLEYPTSLEVTVKQVDIKDLPKPMLTVCDLNGLRRTAFCKDRSFCGIIRNLNETQFCEEYENYCLINNYTNEDNFLIPFANAMGKADYNRRLVENIGTRPEDILKLYKENTSEIIFPNQLLKSRRCYTLDLEKVPKYKLRMSFNFEFVQMLGSNEIANILLNFNLNDIFRHSESAGARVALHSKDQIVNPFINGFLIEPGKRYIIQLKAIEHNLLPPPYSTNCTKYEEMDKNPFNETINQDRCIIECIKENWEKTCECISNSYPFRFEGEFCSSVDCIQKVNNDECYQKCRKSCRFTVFEYDINEFSNDFDYFLYPKNLGKDYFDIPYSKWLTEMTFLYKRLELHTYRYKAQYEMIELFGYVGGYIGVWLGISLIAVFDLLEIIIVYIYNKLYVDISVKTEGKSNSSKQVTKF
ncbi:amiloride-sensitive sodium channel subunit alpha-like isoform X2 [Centruroides vittatus]